MPAIDLDLTHQALAALRDELAINPDRDHPFWRTLAAGTLLRVLRDGAFSDSAIGPLNGLEPTSKTRALNYAASARRLPAPPRPPARGEGPTPLIAEATRLALKELAQDPEVPLSGADFALELWTCGPDRFCTNGSSPSSRPAAERAGAGERYGNAVPPTSPEGVDLAIQFGLPIGPVALADWIEGGLGAQSLTSDPLLVTVLKCHPDKPEECVEVARRIGTSALRLHGLFELALSAETAAPGLLELAESTHPEAGREPLWPHLHDLQLAAVRARLGGDVATPLAQGLAGLARNSAPDQRVRGLRIAFLASALAGRWAEVFEQFISDRVVQREPAERNHLLFEAAAILPWLQPHERESAFSLIAEVVPRISAPQVRGLVAAELARQCHLLPSRSAAIWLGEAKKAFVGRPDEPGLLPKILRLMAEADARATFAELPSFTRPIDRALCAMMVAEVASGLREG